MNASESPIERAKWVLAVGVASWFILVHSFGSTVGHLENVATLSWNGPRGTTRTVARIANFVAAIAYDASFLALLVTWAKVFIALRLDRRSGTVRWRAAMLVFPFGTAILGAVLNFLTPRAGFRRVPTAGYPLGRIEPNVFFTDLRNVVSVGGWICAVIVAIAAVRLLPPSADLLTQIRRPVATLDALTALVAAGTFISYLAERHIAPFLTTSPAHLTEPGRWLFLPIGSALAAALLAIALISAKRLGSEDQNDSPAGRISLLR